MMTLQQTQNTTAENVRRLRNEHHLSLNALAEKCGVCANSIIADESGQGNPRIKTLYKIAAYFGVELCELQTPAPKAKAPKTSRRAETYVLQSSMYMQAVAEYLAKLINTDDFKQ